MDSPQYGNWTINTIATPSNLKTAVYTLFQIRQDKALRLFLIKMSMKKSQKIKEKERKTVSFRGYPGVPIKRETSSVPGLSIIRRLFLNKRNKKRKEKCCVVPTSCVCSRPAFPLSRKCPFNKSSFQMVSVSEPRCCGCRAWCGVCWKQLGCKSRAAHVQIPRIEQIVE